MRRRIRVALDQEPGDLLITGGQVVNVFNRRVEPADVVIADGRIAGVGCYAWRASRTISAAGLVILPGPDRCAHAPGEHALDPGRAGAAGRADGDDRGDLRLARGRQRAWACGGSTCWPRPARGCRLTCSSWHRRACRRPQWEDAGAVLGPARGPRRSCHGPRVLGLAEVMDIPAVLAGGQDVLEKVETALAAGRVVDGHAAGLSGRELIAYAAAGIRSDHESTTVEEARAKCALGMLVQVREGSSAQNLDALLAAAGRPASSTTRGACVTDDIFPNDLRRHGHLDGLLRRLVAGGVAPAVAVRHAVVRAGPSLRARRSRRRCARLLRRSGAGRRPRDVSASQTVIKSGAVAARDGKCLDVRSRAAARTRKHGSSGPARRTGIPPAAVGGDLSGDRDRARPDHHPAHAREASAGSTATGRSTRSATSS